MELPNPTSQRLYHNHPPAPQQQQHYQPATNGVQHDPRHNSAAHINGYTNGQEMNHHNNPYAQQYGAGGGYGGGAYGYGQQQPQPHQQQVQQYRPQQQLPPLQSGIGGPGGLPPPAPQQLGSSHSTSYGQAPLAAPPSQVPSSMPQQPAQLEYVGENGQYRYRLKVMQQPQRARMCGFGDKDRRPITPPPCIKLIIRDIRTGNEVDSESVDSSFFVLQVDLWDEAGVREVNIVRASGSSPAMSISAATTTSYPPPPERAPGMMHQGYGQPMVYQGADGQMYQAAPSMPGYGQDPYYGQQYGGYPPQPQQSSAMFTRNLIGSLAVNAAKLSAPKEETGFWFVLQDLSVRTEGWFRLKMNFIDLANGLHSPVKDKAPVLASTFSDKFQVFSAKKFPGVIESTALSKEFAKQGIKIPIRKDNSKGDAKDEDDED